MTKNVDNYESSEQYVTSEHYPCTTPCWKVKLHTRVNSESGADFLRESEAGFEVCCISFDDAYHIASIASLVNVLTNRCEDAQNRPSSPLQFTERRWRQQSSLLSKKELSFSTPRSDSDNLYLRFYYSQNHISFSSLKWGTRFSTHPTQPTIEFPNPIQWLEEFEIWSTVAA